MTKLANTILRDAILVALREADGPLSTRQVTDLMPWEIWVRDYDCREWPSLAHVHNTVMQMTECRVSKHTYRVRPSESIIYALMRGLERKGQCSRLWIPNDRRVFWQYAGDRDSVAALEDTWSRS